MKFDSRRSFFAILVCSILVLAGCSSPTPPAQQSSKPAEPAGHAATPEPSKPAVEQPAKTIDQARAAAPAPKPKPQVREVPRQIAAADSTSRPATRVPAAPATAPSSSRTSDTSGTPGTLTLPAPVAPPIAVPAPPDEQIKPITVEPPPPHQVTVPSGTLVSIRMIDSVDSETARVGETFKASLDAPLIVDNETVFPKGSEVYVKLSKVESAGRVSGRSEVQLQLERIFLGRKSYTLDSSTYVNTGASQGGKTARSAGIGAALGAAIGAISGGGKGAAIGAATGAGAGAGVEAIRKGEQVRVDSETRLDFRLEAPLEVTLQVPSPSTSRNNPSGPTRLGTRP